MLPGGPVRQPYAGVDFIIPPVRDYEFSYSLQRWDGVGECVDPVGGGRECVDIWPGVQMYSKSNIESLHKPITPSNGG